MKNKVVFVVALFAVGGCTGLLKASEEEIEVGKGLGGACNRTLYKYPQYQMVEGCIVFKNTDHRDSYVYARAHELAKEKYEGIYKLADELPSEKIYADREDILAVFAQDTQPICVREERDIPSSWKERVERGGPLEGYRYGDYSTFSKDLYRSVRAAQEDVIREIREIEEASWRGIIARNALAAKEKFLGTFPFFKK